MISSEVVDELCGIVGKRYVITSREDLIVYESDASIFRGVPDAVVLPASPEEIAKIVQLCLREKIPFVSRGSGTSISGGPIPATGGVIIQFSRMDRILEVDYENCLAVMEAGAINVWLSNTVGRRGYFYPPDPSSQQACTIGGNLANNSGGPHCLKYGSTANHVLGLELVLPSGEMISVGAKTADPPGYDLTGVIVGSEGTLAIVTKAYVRIARAPEYVKTLLAAFDDVEDASNTVSSIIRTGIIPSAVEMMDRPTLEVVDAFIPEAGYPRDAEATLLIELDGLREDVEKSAERVVGICKEHGSSSIKIAKDDAARKNLWAGRKGAFGAMGRLSPHLYLQDGVIPRTKLPQVLKVVAKVGEKYSLRIANVFHAGDGNLHPILLFDARKPGETQRVVAAGSEILAACVEMGGTITGEHGVGLEKRDQMPLLFSREDLEAMRKLKAVFNPHGLYNPEKVFPTSNVCMERQSTLAGKNSS